ncbi:glycosyltransferase family 39 protein [Candidatus Poribacteria bacterium]|nr:glycosyltransferase family 39 protein [Candidatus Poribacteria bacterium]
MELPPGASEEGRITPRRPPGAASQAPALVIRLAGLLALAWAALQVCYFLRANTALFRDPYHERPLGVFSGLFALDWSFSLENSPPLTFAGAVLMAALTSLLGALLLRAADVFVRPRTAMALGFTIGAGVSGVVFELITMARGLYLAVAWGAWAVMLGAAAIVVFARRNSPVWRWWHECPLPHTGGWEPALDQPGTVERARIQRGSPPPGETPRLLPHEAVFWWLAFVLVLVITAATFWHAVFYPETYWDSLILYLGYARMTFLEHAFPFKATAQVGIGLGANYPHLFSNYGAVASTMFGGWSDLYQRFAAPFAGVCSCVLIYDLVLLVWGRRHIAMAAVLLFRATPHSIAYTTFASDYAFTILFACAFLYLAAFFAKSRLPGAFLWLTFVPAAAMHLNYLMGILCVPWLIAVLLSARKKSTDSALTIEEQTHFGAALDEMFTSHDAHDLEGQRASEASDPDYRIELESNDLDGLPTLVGSRWFWLTIVLCALCGSTWFVRNTVLTHNPGYAFFPGVFTGSVNVNPDVLESAELEWYRNGDGVSRPAEEFVDYDAGRAPVDQGAPDFRRRAALKHKLEASWLYWAGFETFAENEAGQYTRGRWLDRLTHLTRFLWAEPPSNPEPPRNLFGEPMHFLRWPHVYKMAPLTLGFALPGLLLGAMLVLAKRSSVFEGWQPFHRPALTVAWWTSATLAVCLLAFHYLIADFYLYQIVCILAPMSFLAACVLIPFSGGRSHLERFIPSLTYAFLLVAGMVPGVAMSLMSFKVPAYGTDLRVFRHPGVGAPLFYRMYHADDPDTWDYINEVARGTALLTHENRHLVFDPTIELVHLDDWDVQQTYGMTDPLEKLRFYRNRGVVYYLRTPNERNHPINARAGLEELMAFEYLRLVRTFGENSVYRFDYSPLGHNSP